MPNLSLIARRTRTRLKNEGIHRTIEVGQYHLGELWYDFRHGVRTCGYISLSSLGIAQDACNDYSPAEVDSLSRVLKNIGIEEPCDVFIDFGSGLGRVVLAAAMFPLRTVIGVEFSSALNQIAETNVQQMRAKLICKDIRLIQSDATCFTIPSDATLFFFFNPFGDPVLSAVLHNIHQSILAAPRQIKILYVPPLHQSETIVDRCNWLVRQASVRTRLGRELRIYVNQAN